MKRLVLFVFLCAVAFGEEATDQIGQTGEKTEVVADSEAAVKKDEKRKPARVHKKKHRRAKHRRRRH